MVCTVIVLTQGEMLMSKNLGALPDRLIRQMMEAGFIKGASPANVSPASLDLSMSEEVYRITGHFNLAWGSRSGTSLVA